MKFTVPQKELSLALTRCAAIAPPRAGMPILASVLLDPLAGLLRICATDLEVGYTTAVGGLIWDDEWPGGAVPFLLNAKTVADCVKAIPSGEVAFAVTENSVIVTGGTASFTLTPLDAAEYPGMAVMAGETLTITADALARTVKHIAYCRSSDESKPNLTGCLLQVERNEDGDLFVVASATDGHRLCLDTNPLLVLDDEGIHPAEEPIPAALLKGVIIPAKGIAELIKLGGTGTALLGITGNTLTVSLGDEVLSLQLAEGTFPDVARVIPQDPPFRIQTKRQALIDAVERCRIITNKDSRGVDLTFDNDTCTISSALPTIGAEATDRISIEFWGECPSLRVNSDYLLQTLTNLSGAAVEIRITAADAPIIINPVGTDFPQAVIMPMRGA